MRRSAGTSEERSGLNQPTNPPWIQIFSTQPCICRICLLGISVKSRKFSRARWLARAQNSCMQSSETVIYTENLKFCTPTHPFSLPSAEAPTRGSEPENQPTNPSCVYLSNKSRRKYSCNSLAKLSEFLESVDLSIRVQTL